MWRTVRAAATRMRAGAGPAQKVAIRWRSSTFEIHRHRDAHHQNTGSDNSNTVRVRSDTKTASLSGWLTTRLRETKEPLQLTTIGMTGLNQMIKSLSVAQELLIEEGLLYCRASKSETVTEKGLPASYFSIHVVMKPPTDLSNENAPPHRVGSTSHFSALNQITSSAQKIGQTCVLSIAGADSARKAVSAIASLDRRTEFLPSLVKNDEGEYTAMHLRILPLPGAPKVVFVSKYTKPTKLAGYLRYIMKDESSSKVVKLVASAESQEAIRSAAKACEFATDYLEQDRIPLTMSVEEAEDDDSLNSGSYVFTLTREVAKEQNCLKVTVGIGNLDVEKVIDNITKGLEGGRLVHLRSTLSGLTTALQALTQMSETYPVSFYSRAKELSYGTNQERLLTSQLDRFFVEWMVEKVNVPRIIDHKVGSEEHLKIAAKTRDEFVYRVHDSEKIISTANVLSKCLTGRPNSFKVTCKGEGIGMVFNIQKDTADEEKMKLIRKNTMNLPFQSGFGKLVETIEKKTAEGWVTARMSNRHQYTAIFRALSKLKLPFYFVKEDVSNAPGSDKLMSISIAPMEAKTEATQEQQQQESSPET